MLPSVANDAQFDALKADEAQVARLLDYVATMLNIEPLASPIRGSALVGMNESSVIKLMPPFDDALAATEQVCLSALEHALPVETPHILDAGTLDGWSYLHMTRLPGVELKEHWPTLDSRQKLSIATQLGECLQTLNELPPPAELPRCDWPTWSADRIANVRTYHQGATATWLEALPELLAAADLSAGRVGWLHTEVMLEHLLVRVDDGAARLSGMFDFEPSWVGPVHYEYASVALFVSSGDAPILGEALRAAGESISSERLFAMSLMHRYGTLEWYRQRLGGPDDLQAWIQRFFNTDSS